MSICHETHETEFSFDSSSYDEYCVKCGATDSLGSWGKLAEPCQSNTERKTHEKD